LGERGLFVALVLLCAAWVLAWLRCGCSASWPELLRVGACLGAVAAAWGARPGSVAVIWVSTTAVALAMALGGCWSRKRLLAASEVPAALADLAEIQERLCLWGGEPLPALRADADVRGTAERLLEFEERLPTERLDPAFFSERGAWRLALADTPEYSTVLYHLSTLKAMIREPATRVLTKQVLARAPVGRSSGQCQRQLGWRLAGEVVRFAVPRIDVSLPEPAQGWELGKIDLALLRSIAAQKAAFIPSAINTRASRRSTTHSCGAGSLPFGFE